MPNETPEQLRDYVFDSETASAAGKKSVEVRRAKKENPPTLEELRARGPEVLADLINAGLGEGRWRKLDHKEQASALKTVLPYLIGRPSAMKPQENGDDEAEPQGFTITSQKAE